MMNKFGVQTRAQHCDESMSNDDDKVKKIRNIIMYKTLTYAWESVC